MSRNEDIGMRITYIREHAGDKRISMADFGKSIGVSSASINQWEKGKTNVPQSAIMNICRQYKINETWLLTGEGSMKDEDTNAQRIARVVSQLRTEDEYLKNSLIYAITRADEHQLRLFLKEIMKELKRLGIEDFDD